MEEEWISKRSWRQRPLKVLLTYKEYLQVEKFKIRMNCELSRFDTPPKKKGPPMDSEKKEKEKDKAKRKERKEVFYSGWKKFLLDEVKVLDTTNGMRITNEGFAERSDIIEAFISYYVRISRDLRNSSGSRIAILEVFHANRKKLPLASCENVCQFLPLFVRTRKLLSWHDDEKKYYNMLHDILCENREWSIDPILHFIMDQVKHSWIERTIPSLKREYIYSSEDENREKRMNFKTFAIVKLLDSLLRILRLKDSKEKKYDLKVFNVMKKLLQEYDDSYSNDVNYMLVKYVKSMEESTIMKNQLIPFLRPIYQRLKRENLYFSKSDSKYFPPFRSFVINFDLEHLDPHDDLIRLCECGCSRSYLYCEKETFLNLCERIVQLEKQIYEVYKMGNYEKVIQMVDEYIRTSGDTRDSGTEDFVDVIEMRFESYLMIGEMNLAMIDYNYLNYNQQIFYDHEEVKVKLAKGGEMKKFLFDEKSNPALRVLREKEKNNMSFTKISELFAKELKNNKKESVDLVNIVDNRNNPLFQQIYYDNSSSFFFYVSTVGGSLGNSIIWFNLQNGGINGPLHVFETSEFAERMRPRGNLIESFDEKSSRMSITSLLVRGPFLLFRVGDSSYYHSRGYKSTIVVSKWNSPDCYSLIEKLEDFNKLEKMKEKTKNRSNLLNNNILKEKGNMMTILKRGNVRSFDILPLEGKTVSKGQLLLVILTGGNFVSNPRIETYYVKFGEGYNEDSKHFENVVSANESRELDVSNGSIFLTTAYGIIEYDSELNILNAYTARLNDKIREFSYGWQTEDHIQFLGCTSEFVIIAWVKEQTILNDELIKKGITESEDASDYYCPVIPFILLFSRHNKRKAANLIRILNANLNFDSWYFFKKIGRFLVFGDSKENCVSLMDFENGSHFELITYPHKKKKNEEEEEENKKNRNLWKNTLISFDKKNSNRKNIRILEFRFGEKYSDGHNFVKTETDFFSLTKMCVTPYDVTFKVKKRKKCEFCSKAKLKMKRCSRCLKVYYCSVDCQKKDWKRHKKIC